MEFDCGVCVLVVGFFIYMVDFVGVVKIRLVEEGFDFKVRIILCFIFNYFG